MILLSFLNHQFLVQNTNGHCRLLSLCLCLFHSQQSRPIFPFISEKTGVGRAETRIFQQNYSYQRKERVQNSEIHHHDPFLSLTLIHACDLVKQLIALLSLSMFVDVSSTSCLLSHYFSTNYLLFIRRE